MATKYPSGTVNVALIRSECLYNTDIVGKIDPYVVIKLGEAQVKKSSVYQEAGANVEFKQEEFTFTYAGGNGPTELCFTVMDKDTLSADDFVGQAVIDVRGVSEPFEDDLKLYRYLATTGGVLRVKVTVQWDSTLLPGILYPPPVLFPAKIHHNRAVGVITDDDVFTTFEMPVRSISEIFGEVWNKNYDEHHARLFANTIEGVGIRKLLTLEHAMLYRKGMLPNSLRITGPRTETKWIGTATHFLKMLNYGIRGNKRRVYTYAVIDKGLFFSETGYQMTKDTLSKHAVHANASPQVRMAGTFRICNDLKYDENDTRRYVCVVDNDSGTYRPNQDDLSLLKKLFELNFQGLRVRTFSVIKEQPKDTKHFIGPCEVENANCPRVYKGTWVWNYKSKNLRRSLGSHDLLEE